MQLRSLPRPSASRVWPLSLLWLGLAVPHGPAAAFDGPSAASAPGPWELSEVEGPRKCRILLRSASGDPAGASIGMPAGCKRAFPVLGQAGAWSLSADHHLALADRNGRVILAFAPGPEDRLLGTGPNGESYELEPVGRARPAVSAAPAAAASAPTGLTPIRPLAAGPKPTETAANAAPAAASRAAAADPAAPVVPYPHRPEEIAGRYVILREGDRDVGCLLTLDGTARGPGGHKAQLAPACRDQGIVVFDPVGWRFERGHLVLRARKGHDLHLQYHSDGVWRKDPKDGGSPIGFKKI